MGFFSRYGQCVERALHEAQCNPGDIIIKLPETEMEDAIKNLIDQSQKETTEACNGMQAQKPQPQQAHNHPPKGGYMPPKTDPFELQMIAAFGGRFQEEYPHGKQPKRSPGQKVRGAARDGEEYRNVRGPSKKEKKSQRRTAKRNCESNSAVTNKGRVVGMVLEGVVFNGEYQPFERR
ncbi:hypothetical protein AVT69_gp135 [Pseudomonas phage PhiPA3]|uniref:Uncharacterized protein 137 n=1 Tax=Pseudomonas phage PhiPA3 TaxID=998086 RepID=F8SK10_BPPA3|nr:hypothetical protein AVT69_gp135 [Pseudomonas phage PhiPA3]AEH03560.1 hypothetical protein [Pseudomonas phage PhiPA3]